MFEREVYRHYQIPIDRRFLIGYFDGFESNNNIYLLVPKSVCTIQDPNEIIHITQYLNYMGDYSIAKILPTVNRNLEGVIDGVPVFLFQLPKVKEALQSQQLGKKLAEHHKRGIHYRTQNDQMIRTSKWFELWGNRINQLQSFFTNLQKTGASSAFDQLFIESFPYYEGIAENAIQYIVDTGIDNGGYNDVSTITHQRFSPTTWIKVMNDYDYIKLPIHFIIDEPVRDVAEWIRSIRQTDADESKIEAFITEYQSEIPLSSSNLRKLYGRLLFPISYIDTVESYYLTDRESVKQRFYDQLQIIIKAESTNELFLSEFQRFIGNNTRQISIPEVEWLQN